MDTLAELSSTDTGLPWLWIIEYLAGFKEVDTSILHDLVDVAPALPEHLAKNTREMVALRCLEDLFDSSNGQKKDDVSGMKEKFAFALSESCEDVLQHIMQETSASDLKMAGPEFLKWDVHPFIRHKRASMPKCALQRLKDRILEGTNLLAASLKESSELMNVNKSGRTHTDDVDRNALTLRVEGSGTDAQTLATNENLIPPTRENGNELSGDGLHKTNLLPSKRDRNESIVLAAEKMAGHINETQGELDLYSNAKKVKQGASCIYQSVKEISVLLHGDAILEDVPEKVDGFTEVEGCNLANQSQDAGMEDSQFPEDGYDEFVLSKKLGIGKNGDGKNGDVNDDEIQHNQTVAADKMPQDISGDEYIQNVTRDEVNVTEPITSTGAPSLGNQQKDSVDKPKFQVEHFCEGEMSSDNDEYRNERIDVAKKKSHFLSSQCSLDNDSVAATSWTEQNLCVKCNKDGQLLVCNTSSCPLVVHEDCLGSPVKFDEKGKFYCPFCAYSLAISEYLEAKKKASLAKKELAAFVHMGMEQHPKELAERLHKKEYGHSRQNGDKENHENGHLGGQQHSQVNQNCQHLSDVNNNVCQESIGNKQQSEPSASCVNDHLPHREEVANVISGTVCISSGESLGEENTVKECASVRRFEGQQDQEPAKPSCDRDNVTSRNADVTPMDHRDAEGEVEKEDLQEGSSNPSEKPVFALNFDGEETSDEENDKFIISNYSIRFRSQEKQYTYPARFQLRRKNVPWTAKEEEILKKGVRKFTRVHDRNIPWKKILEFGSSVFLKGRTTIDLKDKWRNMCKGSPRSK